MPHKKVIADLDAWLIGYPGYMPSPLHRYAAIGEASGRVSPPTLLEWRVMQSTAVATDLGMISFGYAIGVEGTSSQIGGLSRLAAGFQTTRIIRYARLTPALIALTFVGIALSNWTRDPNLWTDRQASWAAQAAVFE